MAITLRGNADSDFSNGIDSDGNIEGDIFIGTTSDDGADSSAFITRQNGANNFQVTGGGTVRIGGTIPGDPNILLNADGSAEFANTVRINDPNNATPADREGVTIGQAGNVSIFTQAGANSGTQVFQIFDTNGLNQFNITENGTFRAQGTGGNFLQGASANNNEGIIRLQNTLDNADACVASFVKNNGVINGNQVFIRFGVNGYSAGSGQINANGASACAFGVFSDERLKENIVDLPSQWDNIKNIRPVEFDYIESQGGGHQIGFVAQEFQKVYPDTVASSKMFVGDKRTSDEERLTLTGWSKTEARLVKALQEAMARIETLESRLSTLEGGNT